MFRFLLVFIATVFATVIQAASLSASRSPGTILVWGDSLSAGYGLEQDSAWPKLLDKKLAAERYPYKVVNGSISGETTAGGRSRMEAALAQHHPSIVILELGANDGLRGLPIKSMRENLAAMISAAQQADAKVVLVGMRMPPNLGPSYTEKFQQTYADLSLEYKTPLVPFLMEGFAGTRTMFQADSVHPTAAAQPIVLNNIWPALKPLLKR